MVQRRPTLPPLWMGHGPPPPCGCMAVVWGSACFWCCWLSLVSSTETLAMAQEAVLAELEDEPLWDHSIEFTWSRFFEFLRQPRSYSTSWCLGRLAELHSASLKVLQHQCVVKGDVVCDILEEAWNENGEDNPVRDSVIWLLRTGQHYDLLLPRRLQKSK